MGCLNSHHSHQKRNVDLANQDWPSRPHNLTYEETTRQAFEEKWFANPQSNASYEDFTILETVTKGSMVSVIHVKHNSSQKSFTMKVFDKKKVAKLKTSGLSLEHLESEKRLLQAISHPFILGLDFHFVDNAKMYFIQEHLPGDCILFRHLKVFGRFSENLTCFYAAQVVQAVEYLHSTASM